MRQHSPIWNSSVFQRKKLHNYLIKGNQNYEKKV